MSEKKNDTEPTQNRATFIGISIQVSLLALACLLLSATRAKADSVGPTWQSVGPTWQVTAAGIFNGGGSQSEAFALNWTVTFVTYPGSDGSLAVYPEYSGTTVMTGVLGTVNETMKDVWQDPEMGHIAFWGPAAGVEIDITLATYYPYGPNAMTLAYVTKTPPVILPPYLWSCEVAKPCDAYGSGTGIGLYSGWGPIVQTAIETPAATPEPGSLALLLSAALFGLPFVRRRKAPLAA